MTNHTLGGCFNMCGRQVRRVGFGAMQLAGPGVFGPPNDWDEALAVLREAAAIGVNHIDTSDYYGPHITNRLIREALSPYPDDLLIVTKIGARRDRAGGWIEAMAPDDLRRAVEGNIESLGLDALDVVNLRAMFDRAKPAEGSLDSHIRILADLQRRGLVRHVGLSNVTSRQVAEARDIIDVVCVQNHYNLAHRNDDDLIDELAQANIAYVPFFPLGGFDALQSSTLDKVARKLNASPMQTALAWLLQRSPNILLIPGTSSVEHLRENCAASSLSLPENATAELDTIGFVT